jgi:cyclopropane fatty-acyl-phospholipid synthase-like methyltransferase
MSDLHDFEATYGGEPPPWDIGRPQAEFLRLAEAGELRGRVLDVGCGTGEHALMAAALGLDATGVDLAPTAIRLAEKKAEERGVEARFLVIDALDLAPVGQRFDTVLDCGLFHVFDDADRPRFVESLSAAVVEGGRYHMLCFSDEQPGDWGPRRVTEAELRASFAEGWQAESIERSVLELVTRLEGAQAWLATFTRV